MGIKPGEYPFTESIKKKISELPASDWQTEGWVELNFANQDLGEPRPEAEIREWFETVLSYERKRRSIGGIIRDLEIIRNDDEELRFAIYLESVAVMFKVANIAAINLDLKVTTWLQFKEGATNEFDFRVKIDSDSNKASWGTILNKAFAGRLDEKAPWPLIVQKAIETIEKVLKSKKKVWTLGENEPELVEYLLPPLLQKGQLNEFFGMGANGKTILSLYISKILADQNIKTLFIDYENKVGGWEDKLRRLGTPFPNKNLLYYDPGTLPLYSQLDEVKEMIEKEAVDLIVVDSASLASGDTTSDEGAALKLMSALLYFKKTVLLLAHQRKNEGENAAIGSVQYFNQARNVWFLARNDEQLDSSDVHLEISHRKSNNTRLFLEPLGFKIHYDGDHGPITISQETVLKAVKESNSKDKIWRYLSKQSYSQPISVISEAVNVKESTAKKLLFELQQEGKAVHSGRGEQGMWSLGVEKPD